MDAQTIINYYQQYENNRRERLGEVNTNTSAGLYMPTALGHMEELFKVLFSEGLIEKGQSFLDMGSGDGRVLAFASIHGLQAYGIEAEEEFYKASIEMLSNLSLKVEIVQGNFLEEKPYKKLKKSFKDFNIIFNFINGCNEIAEKIAEESKQGTLFLLYDTSKVRTNFEGLQFIKTVTLKDKKAIKRYEKGEKFTDLPMLIDYLHVYRK